LDGEPEANTNPASSATGSAQASELIGKFSAFGQSLLDKLAALDRIGWLIVAGVLALPAILLGLFSLSRRTGNSRPAEPNPSPLSERVEPGLQTRRLRHEREAAELFDDEVAKASAVSDEIDTSPLPMSGHAMSFEDSLDDTPEHDAVTRLAAKPLSSDGRALPEQKKTPLQRPANDEIAAPRQSSENPVWQSAFGSWLMHQPEQDRMGFCIEFLIYWVAYSDDRYQPDLRKRLFTATDLSPHDQIKRWVLKQDVFAFSDVVNWLRRNGSPQQLDQCVALIMALLVTENNITPVQNTLIRFFADAFNIGIDRVERRFENAFGHALPPIPRPDKALWWDKQQESSLTAWDARAMANNSEHEQLLARLGLQANYEDAQIIQAFRRAARRCHPDRFTELGDRERSMAEQQFIKFEQARDKLLGVSV